MFLKILDRRLYIGTSLVKWHHRAAALVQIQLTI